MFRIIFFIIVIAVLSFGLSVLADLEGDLIIRWPGGEIQPSLLQAAIALMVLLFVLLLSWTLFRLLLTSPGNLRRFLQRKKQKKGLDALSGGLIAIGAGDRELADRYASSARKTLPNDPMTQFLRAQAAELAGDTRAATRIFESMLSFPDTELMGLRGLFKLAIEQSEVEAASQYASRAIKRNADLDWAVMGLFDLNCRQQNWQAALNVLDVAKDHNHLDDKTIRRRRAVLLTAVAEKLEEKNTALALEKANEAHRLAPTFVPAAVIAGRIYASMGKMSQTAKIIKRCWKVNPHPDLAIVNAFARPGDSVRDRLNRVRELAQITPGHREAAVAVAVAAIEAKDWALAREYLGPLSRGNPSQRVCTLMAQIEGSERGDRGSMREWLARAVHAKRDPAWVADGVVADEWAPTSPVTGKLDAFEWKVPQEDPSAYKESLALEKLLQSVTIADRIALQTENERNIRSEHDSGKLTDLMNEPSVEADPPLIEVIGEPVEEKVIEEIDDVPVEEVVTDHSIKGEQAPVEDEKEALIPDTAKKNVKKKGSPNTRKKRTKIFVSPPAPDDPGIEASDEGDRSNRLRPVRF